jgi:ABC-type spermidine/putrescine transport system permease subunit I
LPRSLTGFLSENSKYLLIIPPVAFFVFFLLIPTILVLLLSLNAGQALAFNPTQLTLENYTHMFERTTTYLVMRDTFGMSLIGALVTFAAGYPIAYYLAFKMSSFRLQGIILFLLVAPYWVDWSIRSISWLSILGGEGLVNYALMSLGLIQTPVKELLFTRGTLVIIWVQTNLVFFIFPTYLSLVKVDPELVSVAQTLGASPRRAFYNITFKLSLPGAIVGLIFVFVSTLGDYVTPALWAGGMQMLGLTIQNYFFEFRWPVAATYSALMLGVTLLILFVLLRMVNIKQVFYE